MCVGARCSLVRAARLCQRPGEQYYLPVTSRAPPAHLRTFAYVTSGGLATFCKMASVSKQHRKLLLFSCFLLFRAALVSGQVDYSGRQYNRDGVYVPPNPGDGNYRTYTFNNRRYGQQQPDFYFNHRNPANPRIPGQPNRGYDDEDERQSLPGVIGGWRTDLQGKKRQDSLELGRDIFVKTNYGPVQGFYVYLYDNPDPMSLYRPWNTPVEQIQGTTSVFLGIPYAMPPINEGRFKPPRLHKGWNLIQAVDFGPACPQPLQYTGITKGIRDMDEDCLYLNVYTPTTDSVPQMFPVMFYIHGGEFSHGASNTFPGHIMATFYKVVVVTINYRLGALGFLSTGDVNSPGNYGILDQSMALRWVYDNIQYFNGDRNSITLFGPGAGAASAGLLMVAPKTRDLVSKVIAQSGSALADWAFVVDKYRVQNTSRVFGQIMGCSIESSWKLVNCLKQGRSFYELGNAEFPPNIGFFPWSPVMDMNLTMPYYEGWQEKDWHFLDEYPEDLIRRGSYNKNLKYMSGVTMQEAAFFISNNDSLKPNYEINELFFHNKIKELVLRYNYTLNPEGVYEAIKYMYTYWPDPHNITHIREQYIHMLSDFLYVAPNDKMAKILVEEKVPFYMYVLNTTIESLHMQEWRKVPHNIEQHLLSGAPFMDEEFYPQKLRFGRRMWTDNDRNMSHFFMKAYTDFARYGNPTYTQILGLHFEAAKVGQLNYLNLNTTYNSSIMWNYRQQQSAFWSQYLPTVIGRVTPTYPPTTEYWWEPREPLQIAFWSMSALCLLLIVLVVLCCMLWRNAKRQSDRYYSGNIFMVDDNADADAGIENTTRASKDNIYEYRDTPISKPTKSVKTGSTASLRSSSAASLKELQTFTSSSSNGEPRKGTPLMASKKSGHTKTHLVQGVPQTDV